MMKEEEEYGKSYLMVFVSKDSSEFFAFDVKLAGYFGLRRRQPCYWDIMGCARDFCSENLIYR
jgi:hypothetical protein